MKLFVDFSNHRIIFLFKNILRDTDYLYGITVVMRLTCLLNVESYNVKMASL